MMEDEVDTCPFCGSLFIGDRHKIGCFQVALRMLASLHDAGWPALSAIADPSWSGKEKGEAYNLLRKELRRVAQFRGKLTKKRAAAVV